jgi:hypothetical protein
MRSLHDKLSPEKVASHEPTAVKRNPNQGTGGQTVTMVQRIKTGCICGIQL